MVPPTILESNSEGLRQFRQIYKGQAGAAFFLIVSVWLMAVALGRAFLETAQCVRGVDCWLPPCRRWEFIWPERWGKIKKQACIPLFCISSPREPLVSLRLSCLFCLLKENRNMILGKRNHIQAQFVFSFCLANLQTLINCVPDSRRNSTFHMLVS